jgi:hypothetical protein
LREREQWKALSDTITAGGDVRVGGQSSMLQIASQTCNTEFPGGFVFDTFRGRFIATESFGQSDLDRYVHAPLAALHDLCERGPMYRDAVRGKVRRVEVRWADGGRSSWIFSNGVLVAYVSPVSERMQRGWDAAKFAEAIRTGLPNYL